MPTTKALELSQFSSGLIVDEATDIATLGVQVGIDQLKISNTTVIDSSRNATFTGFTSTGIDDNATATALTINSDGSVALDALTASTTTTTGALTVAGGVGIAGALNVGGNLNVTGTVSGVTATMVGLGNVTNESKATMFANPSFTGNTTLAGELRGPATFTIDPAAVGDNTGTVVIKGNLQVDGTTTTINSTTLAVADKNIVLASGAANAAAADGAGITVDGGGATLLYNSTPDAWSFNKNVGIGTASPDLKLHVDGTNAAPTSSGTTPAGMIAIRSKTAGASHGTNIGVLGVAPWSTWIQAQDANNLATSYPLALNPTGGNVGIGTSSPSERLTVNGRVMAIGSGYTLNPDGGIFGYYNGGGIATAYLQMPASGQIQFWDAGTSAVATVTSTGLGIGTSAPISKLTVHGGTGDGATYDSVLALTRTSSTGNVETVKLVLDDKDTNFGNLVVRIKSTASSNENSGYYTDALTLDGQFGYLGIGTNSPSQKLTVIGEIALGTGSDAQSSRISVADGSASATDARFLFRNGTDTNAALRLVFNSADMVSLDAIQANNSAVQKHLLLQANGGNVFIAATSNTGGGRLDVTSNASAVIQARSTAAGTGDGTADVSVIRAVTSGAQWWANARYDAFSHTWGYGGAATASTAMSISGLGNLLVGVTGGGGTSGRAVFASSRDYTNSGDNAGQVHLINTNNTVNNRSSLQYYNSLVGVVAGIDSVNRSHTAQTGDLQFWTVENGNLRDTMRMTNGNVGIGTTNPLVKLDVVGTIRSSSVSVTTDSTITPTSDTTNQYNITALASATTVAAPSGTPIDGQKLMIRILDNGTPQAITWNATYTVIGATLPTTTIANKMIYVGCIYNATNTRWDVVAVTTQA